MDDFLRTCFSGPTLPATVGLLFCMLYWLLVIVGGFDVDWLDFDLELDIDHESVLDWGFLGLKALNLGEVPLMIWATSLAFSTWAASVLIDHDLADPTWMQSALAFARNVGIGLIVTKLVTWPLKGRFRTVEPNRVEELIGRTCVVTTSEVTDRFGQARCESDGAPLLFNVRCLEGRLAKGDLAEIVDFSPENHVYLVRGTQREV